MRLKVALPVKGIEGEETLDSRFGRCDRFLFLDTETGERYSKENEAKTMGGAGIMAAQSVISQNVDALITPDLGPNAFRVISSAGIDVYRSEVGDVNQLIMDLENGKLEKSRSPTVEGHHGDR
jgi:predicted Fe-Mo cluster-binding NifX family protein